MQYALASAITCLTATNCYRQMKHFVQNVLSSLASFWWKHERDARFYSKGVNIARSQISFYSSNNGVFAADFAVSNHLIGNRYDDSLHKDDNRCLPKYQSPQLHLSSIVILAKRLEKRASFSPSSSNYSASSCSTCWRVSLRARQVWFQNIHAHP